MQFPPRNNNFRTWQARFNPDASKVIWSLIAINGAVYMLWRVDPHYAAKHFVVSLDSLRSGRLWTVVTSAFSQADTMHLASNMITLYFFGSDIGRIFGGKKLLILYLFGGVCGSLAHCGYSYYKEQKLRRGRSSGSNKNVYWGLNSASSSGYGGGSSQGALGASAAVSAISCVDIALFPTRTILLYGLIPMPAALLGLLWLWNDIGGTIDGRGSTVAHAGHLGGAFAGVAFYLAFRRGLIRPNGWW
jgi:membrane associated rhomboid family serine protease